MHPEIHNTSTSMINERPENVSPLCGLWKVTTGTARTCKSIHITMDAENPTTPDAGPNRLDDSRHAAPLRISVSSLQSATVRPCPALGEGSAAPRTFHSVPAKK